LPNEPGLESGPAEGRARPVFLSYAAEDSEAAERIYGSLRAAGIEVWFDRNELRHGDAWDSAIRRQIRDCGLFIPIISSHTQCRPEGYFRLEWKLAVDRSYLMATEKAFLMPVVIDMTSAPEALVPERFREVQWTYLSDSRSNQALVDRVARLLSQPLPSRQVSRAAAPIVVSVPPARRHVRLWGVWQQC
jgi:hypothetical protein